MILSYFYLSVFFPCFPLFLSFVVEIFAILKELPPGIRKVPCVHHAHEVCSAWLSGNYCQLFRLYRTAPFMSEALIKMFIERERKVALRCITKAYVEFDGNLALRKLRG